MKLKVISLTIKKIFYALLGVFSPRSGLVPAAIELNRAIAEAKAKYTKTGHRYLRWIQRSYRQLSAYASSWRFPTHRQGGVQGFCVLLFGIKKWSA